MSAGSEATQPEELRTLALRVLAAQPFSELLGARLGRLQAGLVELLLPVAPFLLDHSGHVHAGVLAYLADTAMTLAAGSVLGRDAVAMDVKVNYLRPVSGIELCAAASVVHAGARGAVCRCDVVVVTGQGERYSCATALGSAMRPGQGVDIAA